MNQANKIKIIVSYNTRVEKESEEQLSKSKDIIFAKYQIVWNHMGKLFFKLDHKGHWINTWDSSTLKLLTSNKIHKVNKACRLKKSRFSMDNRDEWYKLGAIS
jgi:hypothetical protein